MKLYKFINENKIKQYDGGFIVLDNRIYTNPSSKTIKKAGYKSLKRVARPQYDKNNEYLKVTYQDTETTIMPTYEVMVMEEFEYKREE